jgi:hypothetical protein
MSTKSLPNSQPIVYYSYPFFHQHQLFWITYL